MNLSIYPLSHEAFRQGVFKPYTTVDTRAMHADHMFATNLWATQMIV